jgi:hypothetical protein
MKLGLVAALASLASGAGALTIAVVPTEGTDIAHTPEGSPLIDKVVIGCMDGLFDAGHIATDAPVLLARREKWPQGDEGLALAKEGLVDYILSIYVEWAPSSFHKDQFLPAYIDYRILRVSDGSLAREGKIEGIPDSEDASSHVARSASLAGTRAAASCIELLNTLAMGGNR